MDKKKTKNLKNLSECILDGKRYPNDFHECVHVIAYIISSFAQDNTKGGEETINCILEMVLCTLKHLFVDIYAHIPIIQAEDSLMVQFVNNFTAKCESEIIEILQSDAVKKVLRKHYENEHGEFH